MVPVRKVEHPEARHHLFSARLAARLAAHGSEEAAPSQLGFAVRALVAVRPIVFEHVENGHANTQRSGKLEGSNKIEVVGRSVILGKGFPNTPHQAADRQVEAWRAVLSLVITIGRELQNLRRFAAVAENVSRSA